MSRYLRTFAITFAVIIAVLGGAWLLATLALWAAFEFGWWVSLVGSIALLAAFFAWVIEDTRETP